MHPLHCEGLTPIRPTDILPTPRAQKTKQQQVKQKDYHLSHLPLRSICRMVYGTCGTMGLKVDGLKDALPVE